MMLDAASRDCVVVERAEENATVGKSSMLE